jgi:hypothetical protein
MKNLENIITPVLGGVVGMAGAKMVANIPVVAANPAIGAIGKILLGGFLAGQRGELVQSVGLGVAISGGSDIVDMVLPAAGVGFYPDLNPNQVLGTHSYNGMKVKVS